MNWWIVQGLITVGSIYGLLHYNKLSPMVRHALYALIIVFFTNWLMFYGAHVWRNNLWVMHILVPACLVNFGLLYKKANFHSSDINRVIFYSSMTMAGLSILNTVVNRRVLENNTFGDMLLAVFGLIVPLLHLESMMKNPGKKPLFQEPVFFINISIMVFYCLTYFVLVFDDYYAFEIVKPRPEWFSDVVWAANYWLYGLLSWSLVVEVKSNQKEVGYE